LSPFSKLAPVAILRVYFLEVFLTNPSGSMFLTITITITIDSWDPSYTNSVQRLTYLPNIDAKQEYSRNLHLLSHESDLDDMKDNISAETTVT
jgi:hypothetical protein